MSLPNDVYSDSRSARMKPGDRVIWLRSPGRSILTGWRVERIPGVVERVWRRRVGIRVRLGGIKKLAVVDPDNLLPEECHDDTASLLKDPILTSASAHEP